MATTIAPARLNLGDTFPPEKLLREYKAICLLTPDKYSKLVSTSDYKFTEILQTMILETLISPHYRLKMARTICAIMRTLNDTDTDDTGHMYLGVDDYGTITGFPSFMGSHEMNMWVQITLKPKIMRWLRGVDSSDCIFEAVNLNINPDLVDATFDDITGYIKTYCKAVRKYNKKLEKRIRRRREYSTTINIYTSSIQDYVDNMELREKCAEWAENPYKLDHYFKSWKRIYSELDDPFTEEPVVPTAIIPSVCEKLRDKDYWIDTNPEMITSCRTDPSHILFWITKFKDYMTWDLYRKAPPRPTAGMRMLAPRNPLDKGIQELAPMTRIWSKQTHVNYYMIKITITNPRKNDNIFYYHPIYDAFDTSFRVLIPDPKKKGEFHPCCSSTKSV